MALQIHVQRMHGDLYDDGDKEGLVTKFNRFVTDHAAREDERDRNIQEMHRQNSEAAAKNSEKLDELNVKTARKTLWATLVGIAWTAAGAIIALIAIIHEIRH